MTRRAFVGGMLGGGGLVALGCSAAETTSPATTQLDPTTTTARTTTTTTAPPTTTTALPVPSATWDTVAPADAGWDPARLDEAVAFGESRATKALLLVDDGRVVAERYVGVDSTYRREVASCQKSVLSVLAGIAEARSLLRLDDPVTSHLGAGWTNGAADEATITIRHLLSMTSGLDADLRTAASPGTVWSYNNDAYHQLQPVLEAAAGTDIDELCRRWLWDPIGATDSTWAPRPAGGQHSTDAKGVAMWGLTMSARDMARFGLLVQRDGTWLATPVVDRSYLDQALSASSTLNPSYGYLWWLNGADGYRIGPNGPLQPGPLIPTAPPDVVAALGKDDQKIYVSRVERLVLVRQGQRAGQRSTESLSDFDAELWRLIMAARR